MNKKKKSDQDLLHLGLPPMELAESRENVPETNNAGLKKFIYPVLPKIITILILVLVTFGSYITLLMALQNFDVSHNTEIILITGVHDKPNITIGQDNVEIVVELLNNDTYHMPKREKRHAADTLRENENPIAESINDQKIQKAREIIMNHDILCNHENKDKICKEIVNKLKSITEHDEDTQSKQHDENAAKDNLESTNKIKHNHGIYVTSTDKVKRETNPVKDMVRSTSNVPFEGRDSDFYPQENAAHLEPYPPHVHSPISDTCLLARLLKQSYPNLQGVYDSPSSGYLSPPYDSQPLPYSGYAPPVVPAPYNIHSREAEGKRKIHQQDAEIFMKYLQEAQNRPLQPVCNATERGAACAREASCPAGTVSCNDGQGCISEKQWCDGNVDCSDVSDEAVCSCKSRVDVSRICDGYFDCPFGEDEMGCFGCGDSAFSCGDVNINSQSTCFTKEQRCNNIAECPNQRDEMECTMLAPTLHKKPLFAVSNTEGFLHRNFKGDWYPVCKNPYMWAHDACRREAGLIIRSPFMQMVPNDPMSKVTYLNIGSGGLIHTSTTCFNSSAIYVTCPDLVCGTRVPTTSQLLRENAAAENNLFGRNKRFLVRNRPYPLTFYHRRFRRHTLNVTDIIKNSIAAPLNDNEQSKLHANRNKRTESRVVGGNPSKPTAWPWIIAMYRDGMFHCGGVILTQSWIISAAHCVYKFWEHYFEIQVGMLRRFSFSPQEQNHRVTHVIVNQRYNKIDMVNDLSLLRVTPAIIFSRWVRPICLPTPDTAGPDWLWGPPPGTLCTAVGWGATIEHGPDPDNLREVEVPVWDRCNHVEDQAGKVICAGLPEGGKDACQGDSGGPLLCRNPLNSQQWYMAGIVSHGDGCARKGEPGVYTRVSIFDKWIREHISARTLPTIQPKQECPGFKCMSGISKCIPNKRRCDKIVDCLDAEDERNCNFMRSTPTFGNTELFSTPLFEKDSTDNPQHNSKEAEIGQLINKSEIHTSNTQTTANDHLHDVEHHKTKVNEIVTSNDDTLTTHFEKTNPTDTTITATNPETVTEIVITHTTDHTILHGSYMSEPTTSDLNVLNSTEINFWDASPLEMVNGRSSEVSSTVNHSDNVTVNPNGPTISEEMESTNRGDMNTFTMVSSRQPLESSSALKEDKKSRGADIIEDWTDSDTTDSSVTIKENKHISDTVPDSQNHEDQDLELTHTNDENFHLTTIGNDNTELESKGLLLDLTQSSSSLHENNLQNIDHEEALHTSNLNLKTSPAKKLPDLEEKTGIVNKIKDIVLSKLQPAKIRNKHRIPNEFECRRIYQSVPYHKRCDHKADCEDGTDELGCTCTDFLYTFDRKLICDGIFDCADGRDEIDCYNCPEDQFLCKRSQLCLPSNHVCDGKPQCPQGEDELDCFALSNGKNLAYDIDGRPKISLEGYLTKKHTKDWHIVCEDNLSTDQQEQASEHICRYLGFSSANRYIVKHINIKEDDILKKRVDDQRSRRHINEVPIHFAYRQVDEDTARHIVIDKPQVLKEQCVPNVTKTCMSLYVFCDHSLYSEYGVGQELFYNREAEDMTHMWPWVAKIYAEGKYKCTGVLVDLSWVLVSHSCLWDSLLSHHVTVVLGSHRTLSLSDGMYEQVYQVDAKKDFYNSKVALLHLREPAHYSSMVKPMALMSSSNLQDIKSTICVAVGQNENNSTVGVFLRETNAKCDLNSRCYERLQQHENICSPGTTINRPWAGIVSCHTDRGWYPAASFVEKGGECGLGNHIHGSEIGYLKNEMKNFVGRSASNSSEYSDACEGQRCGRGNCVPLTQVCDGVSNCHDGKDESQTACDDKRQICTQNAYHKGCECSTGQLKCHNGNCVAKELFGDGRDDCGDGTDEPKYMTCSAYISRVKPSRLCDGILHCQDRSDEDPMYCKCFAKATYKCRSTHDDADHCVAPDMVCDGVKDCPNGDDEHACMGLSAPEGSTYGTGQVMVRSHGVWYSKCYPTQNHTRDELEGICREVGFISGHAKQLNPPVNIHFHPYNNLVLDPFSDVALNNNTKIKIRNTNEPIAKAIVDNTLENCYPVYIECL